MVLLEVITRRFTLRIARCLQDGLKYRKGIAGVTGPSESRERGNKVRSRGLARRRVEIGVV